MGHDSSRRFYFSCLRRLLQRIASSVESHVIIGLADCNDSLDVLELHQSCFSPEPRHFWCRDAARMGCHQLRTGIKKLMLINNKHKLQRKRQQHDSKFKQEKKNLSKRTQAYFELNLQHPLTYFFLICSTSFQLASTRWDQSNIIEPQLSTALSSSAVD